MPVFRVIVKTVFEIVSDSEFKARFDAIESARKCSEDAFDGLSVVQCGIESSCPASDLFCPGMSDTSDTEA